MIDALHACFGVAPDASAREVVGAPVGANRDAVLAFATERLRQLHQRFPESEPAFIAARARLRQAARELIDGSDGRARDELHALISSKGGWNAQGRAMALRWAALHGIDPPRLIELLCATTTSAPSTHDGATNAPRAVRPAERTWVPWVVGLVAAVLALAATITLTLATLDRSGATEPTPEAASTSASGTSSAPSPPITQQPTATPRPSAPLVAEAPAPPPKHAPRVAPAAPSGDWDLVRSRLDGSRGESEWTTDESLALLERLVALTEAALLLESGRTADARLIVDGIPESFTPPPSASTPRRAVSDGSLATAIDRADGPEARVLALNRWLGESSELGPADARMFASLTLGPQDGLARRAQAIANTRFAQSADLAVGFLDALAGADPSAINGVLVEWLGRAGLDATTSTGLMRIRRELADRAIALSQGDADSVRSRAMATESAWRRVAPLLGVAIDARADGDLGASELEAIVGGPVGTDAARTNARVRERVEPTELARALAWQIGLLESLALPRGGQSVSTRAAAEAALRSGATERANARTVVDQFIINQRLLVTAVGVRAGRMSW